MPTPQLLPDWASLAAIISAMVDVTQLGRDTFAGYLKKRQGDPDLAKKGAELQIALSTFSTAEMASIVRRINDCKERFIREGAGTTRRQCLCSVLQDVKDGNGGAIPDRDWQSTYEQLGCGGSKLASQRRG